MSTESTGGQSLMEKLKTSQTQQAEDKTKIPLLNEESKGVVPSESTTLSKEEEENPLISSTNTSEVAKLSSDPLQDILKAAAQAQQKNPVNTGTSSAAVISPAMAFKSNQAKHQTELPGYYSTNIGNVRLSRTEVIVARQLRGRFYYPLNSKAADYLEKRVGKSVTKVEEKEVKE